MQHEWIVREIEDLARYARDNQMKALAELLDEARTMAWLEIVNQRGDDAGAAGEDSAPNSRLR